MVDLSRTHTDLNPRRMTGKLPNPIISRNTLRFYPSKVSNIIEAVIRQNLEDKEYDQAQAKTQVETIVR